MEDGFLLNQWIHIGTFTTPKAGRDHILYCSNESGEDWYDLVKALPPQGTYALVRDGVVGCVSNDPSKIFPGGFELYWSETHSADLGSTFSLQPQRNEG